MGEKQKKNFGRKLRISSARKQLKLDGLEMVFL
jgi:hypothetical protein